MMELNLDSSKYEELLRVMNVLKDNCNDLDIRDGIIRQRSNDRASIFEINVAHLLENINMPISDLKKNIDSLKVFEKQDISILIDVDDSGNFFQFSNQSSSLRFRPIADDYIDNRFMTDDELNASFILNDEDIILSTTIPKNISDMIKVISSNFNVNSIQAKFEGETVCLKAETQSKTQSAKFYDGIVSERVMTGYVNIVTIPFVIDHDSDITLNMYNVRDNIIISKFSMTVNDTTIVVFTRSSLVIEE